MKRIIPVSITIGFMLFAAVCFAETLTDWERGVFQDIAEQWHALLYTQGGNYQPVNADFDRIYQNVANKYNTSIEEVKRIDGKGINEEPGEYDYKIFDDLTARLNALPQGSSMYDAERIHADIASQYGISLNKLYEIEYKMDVGMRGWF